MTFSSDMKRKYSRGIKTGNITMLQKQFNERIETIAKGDKRTALF
jgi:hypothetical protein